MDLLDFSNLVATQIFVSALFGNLSFAYITFSLLDFCFVCFFDFFFTCPLLFNSVLGF